MFKINDITYSLECYEDMGNNYTQISNDVYKLTNGNEFKIYCYLCSNYNEETGCSSPSFNTIAKDCKMSKATVQREIKRLEEIGLIKILKFTEKTNQYTNNMYRIYYPIIKEEEKLKTFEELFDKEEESFMNEIRTISVADKVQKNKNSRPSNNEKWRKDVLKRDDNTCQLCHCDNSTMHVHHIRRWIDYPELRTDVNNGITLCEKCHYKIYGKEKEYEERFLQIITNRILKPRGENND